MIDREGPLARTDRLWGLLLSAPYIFGLVVFALGPIVFSWSMCFFAWDNITPPRFVGLDNWTRLFGDALFRKACWNTLYFVLGSVPLGVALSLLLAVLVNRQVKGIGVFRMLYFTPVVTSTVAVALVWTWFYDSNYGVLNYLLDQGARLLGLDPPKPMAWLNNPTTAMPAIIAMSVWKGLGYNMVIFLAALQGVPKHLYEAAELDGASSVGRFLHVTLPSISPVTFFVVIVSLASGFQVFDQVYIMAREGRPADSTLTIVYYLYRHAFQYLEMGYASTIGTALFAIILAVTLVQLYGQKRWVHY
ncbi:ABC transporter permease subunit [bacterium]|nr:ABC transporter permease subunit [bacterium]